MLHSELILRFLYNIGTSHQLNPLSLLWRCLFDEVLPSQAGLPSVLSRQDQLVNIGVRYLGYSIHSPDSEYCKISTAVAQHDDSVPRRRDSRKQIGRAHV